MPCPGSSNNVGVNTTRRGHKNTPLEDSRKGRVVLEAPSDAIYEQPAPRASGEIGRRSGLKIRRPIKGSCRFNSGLAQKKEPQFPGAPLKFTNAQPAVLLALQANHEAEGCAHAKSAGLQGVELWAVLKCSGQRQALGEVRLENWPHEHRHHPVGLTGANPGERERHVNSAAEQEFFAQPAAVVHRDVQVGGPHALDGEVRRGFVKPKSRFQQNAEAVGCT